MVQIHPRLEPKRRHLGSHSDAMWRIETSKTAAVSTKFIINFLKSLKPQNKWTPSEEQIKAFEHFVRSIGESGYASPYDNNTKLIYSLLNDLKNIRHER